MNIKTRKLSLRVSVHNMITLTFSFSFFARSQSHYHHQGHSYFRRQGNCPCRCRRQWSRSSRPPRPCAKKREQIHGIVRARTVTSWRERRPNPPVTTDPAHLDDCTLCILAWLVPNPEPEVVTDVGTSSLIWFLNMMLMPITVTDFYFFKLDSRCNRYSP